MIPVVTIDGPSGAGKGTICRLVAESTGFHLLDSGALYRLTALAALQAQCNLDDAVALSEIARNLAIEFKVEAELTTVLLNGQNVTQTIRQEKVGMTASKVAAYPQVREALLERQRAFKIVPGLVADGRDMGTVVFPEAQVKIFLTASAQERARRRVAQLEQNNQAADYDKILADIEKRDEQDRNRATAPLVPAADALELDSTTLSIQQVYHIVLNRLNSLGENR